MSNADALPIERVLPVLIESLSRTPRCVLEAAPGAGKTTRVPLALLGADWCNGRIVMLEPRRIAARSAAMFMARLLGEEVGATVGYRIRHESRVSPATRVEVVTEGILTRMLQDDPMLEGISAVIFDEFHERHLEGDLGLALTLDGAAALRPELRVIVMSATLDGARLGAFLDAPVIDAPGREYPVIVEHLQPAAREPDTRFWRRAAERALAEGHGDVLWFLPGRRDMNRVSAALTGIGADIVFLHGDLGVSAQAAVIAGADRRRVVLSTNVAESSVTLPRVDAVIDSGLVRESRYDPASGMNRLETVHVTRASADQRSGRAGRTGPGRAWRLWPRERILETNTRAEIGRADLARLLLELRLWGSDAVPFLDPPPAATLAEAETGLRRLGALDEQGQISAHGRRVLGIATHPRLASAMLRAPAEARPLAADVAALLAGRNPLPGVDDLRAALQILHRGARAGGGRESSWRAIGRDARRWRGQLGLARDARTGDINEAGAVVAAAFPERVGLRDPADPARYRLAGGGAARLAPGSALAGHDWLALAELDGGGGQARIRRAAPVDLATLEGLQPEQFSEHDLTEFDVATRAVVRRRERRLGQLCIKARTLPPDPDIDHVAILLAGIRTLGPACLPWSDGLVRWRDRVRCVAAWLPELELPALGDAELVAHYEQWLAPWLSGRTRLDQLSASDLSQALRSLLTHDQHQALDRNAPEEISVPSGRRIRLHYRPGETPVLAVKLQEMFGQQQTPSVAGGRVPLVVHLLSPRGNPVQVTRDLAGFWREGYAAVRRELAGRYPRHPWPEDPLAAEATHLTKKQSRRR